MPVNFVKFNIHPFCELKQFIHDQKLYTLDLVRASHKGPRMFQLWGHGGMEEGLGVVFVARGQRLPDPSKAKALIDLLNSSFSWTARSHSLKNSRQKGRRFPAEAHQCSWLGSRQRFEVTFNGHTSQEVSQCFLKS